MIENLEFSMISIDIFEIFSLKIGSELHSFSEVRFQFSEKIGKISIEIMKNSQDFQSRISPRVLNIFLQNFRKNSL